MRLSDFDYFLPKELIAQEGLLEREKARLMVLEADGSRRHSSIEALPGLLKAGDLLILNESRVLPAKLLGRKESGGKIDCLLLPKIKGAPNGHREALLRGSRVKSGVFLTFQSLKDPKRTLRARVGEKLAGARYQIDFMEPALIEECGVLPLPPYIRKPLAEPERYQTVFSKNAGSLAAPTAGLHFTRSLMQTLERQGVEIAFLTLHVGTSTFAPIRREDFENWELEPEYYAIAPEAAERINRAIRDRRRIFAVGTTSVRTLESAMRERTLAAGEGWTKIFVTPGYRFRFPYAGLLTNFHLPKSGLLLLAAAFAGRENILAAYEEAVRERYRFYSLGDAMLILR